MNYLTVSRTIVWLLIIAMVLLGTLSILAIWEIIDNEDVVWKSLTTAVVLGVVGAVALASLKFLEEREREHISRK